MAEFSEIVVASLKGLLSGFLISLIPGPINITILNEGAKRGFRWAVVIGFGAVVMDFIYCAMAFAGFSGLFGSRELRAVIELLSFLAMLYLGIKYLLLKDLPATSKSVELVEHKLHPHTAFMTGFVRVLGNPGVLLFWVTLAATFTSHEWIDDTWASKTACVIGMSMGAFAWFVFLSFVVSLGHGRFSAKTLLRMSHISGASFLIMALIIGIRLVKLIARR
jgi:threonine/homoserine/homoserine lactone efflux protein